MTALHCQNTSVLSVTSSFSFCFSFLLSVLFTFCPITLSGYYNSLKLPDSQQFRIHLSPSMINTDGSSIFICQKEMHRYSMERKVEHQIIPSQITTLKLTLSIQRCNQILFKNNVLKNWLEFFLEGSDNFSPKQN